MASKAEAVTQKVDARTLRLERMLDAPIDVVWPFLVDSDKRARWFMGGVVDPRPGGTITFCIDHDAISPEPGESPDWYKKVAGTCFDQTILAIDPPHMLRFDWDEASQVTFTLEPVGARTRFVILHEHVKDGKAMADFAGGWHTHSFVLAQVVAGRVPANFWKLHEGVDALYAGMKEDAA
jgi:uncharacterized protein YndB with AHSA1/START domain